MSGINTLLCQAGLADLCCYAAANMQSKYKFLRSMETAEGEDKKVIDKLLVFSGVGHIMKDQHIRLINP